MERTPTPEKESRIALAGDGGLFLTGAFATVVGLAIVLGSGSHASNVVWGVLGAVALCTGPLIAWHLHGRRVDGSATGGALLGYLAGAVIVFVLIMLGALAARLVHLIGLYDTVDDAQQGVGLVLGIALAVAYLVVALWLDLGALRDLSAKRRRRTSLDVARLVATGAYVAYAVGVIVVVAAGDDSQAGMSTFLLLAVPGAVGAVVVTAADVVVRRDEERGHGHLMSGA